MHRQKARHDKARIGGAALAAMIQSLRISLPNDGVAQWSKDGGSLYAFRKAPTLEIFSIDVHAGTRQPLKTLGLADPAGVFCWNAVITPDGRGYAYSYTRTLDELYAVDGLR